MPISLNHTIVHARDRDATARFLTEILGLPAHRVFAHFAVVQVGETSLDLVETDQEIASRHFAFLVDEAAFDAILGRIKARRLPIWADPYKREPDRINHRDDGRGVYFEDPNGHLLEILTKPYGSGGAAARQPSAPPGR